MISPACCSWSFSSAATSSGSAARTRKPRRSSPRASSRPPRRLPRRSRPPAICPDRSRRAPRQDLPDREGPRRRGHREVLGSLAGLSVVARRHRRELSRGGADRRTGTPRRSGDALQRRHRPRRQRRLRPHGQTRHRHPPDSGQEIRSGDRILTDAVAAHRRRRARRCGADAARGSVSARRPHARRLKTFTRVVDEFPQSPYLQDARRRLDDLKAPGAAPARSDARGS